jgi:hypothetical protein
MLIINTMAKRGDVSEYMDLTAAVKLAELARLAIPTFLIVKPEAALLADLDLTQQRELSILHKNFKKILYIY